MIASQSGYGGKIKTPVDEIGIGSPYCLDYSAFDGSIGLELNERFYNNQIYAWLFDRQRAAQITVATRHDNLQSFGHCYWRSIGIQATTGAVLTSTLDITAIARDTYTVGGNYIANKEGAITAADLAVGGSIPALNPSDGNVVPVPFWNTTLTVDSVPIDFMAWSVTFNQDVVKFFVCEANDLVQPPAFVAVGPMTGTLNVEYVVYGATSLFTAPDDITALDIKVASSDLHLQNLKLQTSNDDIAGRDGLLPIASVYSIYGLAA